MANTEGKTALERNIAIHNKIAKKYEALHGEIYNGTEQERLRKSLMLALSFVQTGDRPVTVLDFGCGAGNLTAHLADLGCEVIAADVSAGFLDLVSSRSYTSKVTTLTLNGLDLAGVEDDSVSLVAMYSVLHHVPDYLSLMKEFGRVLKPGGVLYIDHEAADLVWEEGGLAEFQKAMKKNSKIEFEKYFVLSNYIDRFVRVFINPKYQREGDIHVFKDDHIEWNEVRKELHACGLDIIHEEDYLLHRRSYDTKTYEEWKNKLGDMHLAIARKR